MDDAKPSIEPCPHDITVKVNGKIVAYVSTEVTVVEKSLIKKLRSGEVTVEGVSPDTKLTLDILAVLKAKGLL